MLTQTLGNLFPGMQGVLVFAEILTLCGASFLLFRTKGNSFAESASYAIVTIFMLLSFIHQIGFITGCPPLSTILEICFLMVSFLLSYRHRACISGIFSTLHSFGSINPVAFIVLGICLVYMAAHGLLPVPEEFQNELNTIALYEKSGFFPLGAVSELPAFSSVNHLILFNTFLRFDANAGAGIFCFLAYLSIGFSTYALARRYAWPATAFTTSLLIMSMPRLAIQAIYPGTQIISICVALFCILALYRSCEQPSLTDLVLLIFGLVFCVSDNISSMIFAPILFVLSGVVLFRRHGMIAWKTILKKNPLALLAVVPIFIFSQSWLFLLNHLNKGEGPGVFSSIPLNSHGIQGALANFIRYLFESLNSAAPIELFFDKIFKWSMAENLESFYDMSIIPFLGDSGANQVFHLMGHPMGMFSFGPAGFFLVLPSLVYAMIKGPRRLKSVALAFFVYFYLACLIMAWTPVNAKFFEIFYVCSGFSISFFLPPWRFTQTKNRIFRAGACTLLFLTLVTAS
jgi:hypothetical protein